jgi:hypothetical protein
MKRKLGPLAMACLLGVSAHRAGAAYLDGSVGIMEQASGPYYSAGAAELFSDFGGRIFNVVVSGTHQIADTQDGAVIAYRQYSRGTGDYNDFVNGLPVGGRCYRARLTASAQPYGGLTQTVYQEWGSAQLCKAEAPPQLIVPPGTQCYTDCDGGTAPSPILFDLDGQGFDLTGVDDPVWFDIDGDGRPDLISWTAGGSRTAFLVLDRDGDGLIENGQELFGNYTPLAGGGTALNGYLPLFEFDDPRLGGNGNGTIDEGDAVFSRLRLWIDQNHNGLSEPSELLTLKEAGVVRIACEYSRSGRRDRYGNLFRYKGKAWILNRAGRERETATYDVFFRRAE